MANNKINILSGPPPGDNEEVDTSGNVRVQLNYLDDIKDLFGNSAVTSSDSITFKPGELGLDYESYPTITNIPNRKVESILLVLLREAFDSALSELDPCMEVKRTFVLKTVSNSKQVLGEQFTVKIFSANHIKVEEAMNANEI